MAMHCVSLSGSVSIQRSNYEVVQDEADEFAMKEDEDLARVHAGSGSHNLDAAPTWRAKDVGEADPRTPMGPADRAPFGSAGGGDRTKNRSRRGTRAVYLASEISGEITLVLLLIWLYYLVFLLSKATVQCSLGYGWIETNCLRLRTYEPNPLYVAHGPPFIR